MSLGVCWLALACSGSAPSTGPEPESGRTTLDRAQASIAAGEADAAIPPLLARVAAAPEDALARATLSHALLLQGDVEGALVQGKLAVGLDPTLAPASWNLACAYARLGDRDAAIAWLQRAVIDGGFTATDAREDPDLASLVDDHRFAVFLATGVLSRAEEDALVMVDRERVRVGEPVNLSVALVQLNREPLAVSRVSLEPGRDQGLGAFLIRSRHETFTRGEAGGREYVQRTVHFELVPQVPGTHQLGPFRFEGADGVHWTTPSLVHVDGEPTGELRAPTFFGLPSVLDPPAQDGFSDDGELWEPGRTLPQELPRLVRLRLPTLEGEITLPARPPGSLRSTLLRRSTEGLSWVYDTAP